MLEQSVSSIFGCKSNIKVSNLLFHPKILRIAYPCTTPPVDGPTCSNGNQLNGLKPHSGTNINVHVDLTYRQIQWTPTRIVNEYSYGSTLDFLKVEESFVE